MRITFGMHVGAWKGPGSRPHLGEPVLARPGFLGLLETHLGLGGALVSAARRAAAYLVALRAADNPQRFYHRSLDADEIGTAVQLLRWRDEWMLAGWDGRGHADWPERLADLAAVEAFAGPRVLPGEGQRLSAVAERLKSRRVPIEAVTLLDPPEAFPARWQDVLSLLPTQLPAPTLAAAGGDLGRVQASCIAAVAQAQLPKGPDLALDGSLTVLQPLSCEVAEHWLADYCRSTPQVARLIVAEERGASVDETMRAEGLPACGFDDPSLLRPALQALPLALETLWDPVDPGRLLEFLTHPIGAVNTRARRFLADAFASEPGIGGRKWSKAREQIARQLGTETLDQVAFWLEGKRSSRAAGAPLDQVVARVARLQTALQLRMGTLQEEGGRDALVRDVAAAIGQCSQMMEGLQELHKEGIVAVRPRLLEQLTMHATANSANTLAIAQVGCTQSATTPGACSVESVDEVIWWMPAKPHLPAPLPWVRAELQALERAGLRLREPAAEMAALMSEWTRPVLAARRQLILVLPPAGSEEHPAWQLLKAMCPNLRPLDIEDHARAHTQLVDVAHTPLPPTRGEWRLEPDAPWRDAYPAPTALAAQSYTSLNLLFNNPAIAVVKDAALLRSGTTLAVTDGTRLLGNLAHRLLERLFAQDGSLRWDEAQVDAWFVPTTDDLLSREGLPVLAAGNAMRLQQFRDTARRGILVLLQHLRHAGAIRVEAERELKGTMGVLDTVGDTDLLVYLEAGDTLALDLKWGPARKYRQRLEDDNFLQLALYSLMIEQELGKSPVAVGFFSFQDATLLTLTAGVFAPTARVIRSSVTPAQLIQSAIETWNWRVQQWEDGVVEVVQEGLEPPATDPPPGCLRMRPLGPWHGDYESLFGLRENA